MNIPDQQARVVAKTQELLPVIMPLLEDCDRSFKMQVFLMLAVREWENLAVEIDSPAITRTQISIATVELLNEFGRAYANKAARLGLPVAKMNRDGSLTHDAQEN